MIGDFNEITGNDEKKGGRKRQESSFLPFRTMIANCAMIEFPYKGNPMSWVGFRRSGKVQCRLDRAIGNEEWHHLFSHTNVEYLKLWGSDHRPVLARIQSRDVRVQRSFKFDKRWLGKDGLEDAIKDGWFHTEIEGGRRQILSGTLGATAANFAGGQSFTLIPDARTDGWVGRFRAAGGSPGFRIGGEVGAEEQQGRAAISLRATLQIGL